MRQTEFIQLPLHMRRQYLDNIFIPRPIAGQGKCVQCANEVGGSVTTKLFCVLHGLEIEKPVHREADGRRAEAHLENWIHVHAALCVSGLAVLDDEACAHGLDGLVSGAAISHHSPLHVRAELFAGDFGKFFNVGAILRRHPVALPLADDVVRLNFPAALIEKSHEGCLAASLVNRSNEGLLPRWTGFDA